jgi:hypothetical protein
MPNRDHDDSQYNRNEGRFENRDEWRDQSNAGSREWDRRGDEFRGQERGSYGQQRGYQPGSFDERREQRLAQQDFGRGGYNQDRQDFRGQGYGQDWNRGQDFSRQQGGYNQDWRTQGSSDWNRGQGYGQDWRSQDYGRSQTGQTLSGYGQNQTYGQDWRSQEYNRPQRFDQTGYSSQSGGYGQHTQDWDRSPYARQDFSRSQSNYGGRDAFRTQESNWGSSQGYGGQFRGDQGREDESWGQQIRQAGQQAARSIKRVFRGPKNYRRSDERIREDVSDRLGLQDTLDPSEIEVTVSSGEVTLSGTVQSRREKYLAEEIADDVSGVNEVNNQLRVRREEASTATMSTPSTTTSTAQNEGGLRNRNARA